MQDVAIIARRKSLMKILRSACYGKETPTPSIGNCPWCTTDCAIRFMETGKKSVEPVECCPGMEKFGASSF
jgi:hypothetical protein